VRGQPTSGDLSGGRGGAASQWRRRPRNPPWPRGYCWVQQETVRVQADDKCFRKQPEEKGQWGGGPFWGSYMLSTGRACSSALLSPRTSAWSDSPSVAALAALAVGIVCPMTRASAAYAVKSVVKANKTVFMF